jgi:saccharopine dehydrogenase-like NADP-dependent oxidoreductase
MSRILILGTGLMGPAAAYNAMADGAVTEIGLADLSQAQLDACLTALGGRPGALKLRPIRLDLGDQSAAVALIEQYDAVVSAVPAGPSGLGIRAALAARKPVVSLTWPEAAELPDLRRAADARGVLVVLGCGVEPGLTEIFARHLAERLDRVDELHIKCGGIPERPAPPLGYKIVFGGRHLPLRDTEVQTVERGRLVNVPRYSGVEPVVFPGVGACEAWHDGFRPWLLDIPAFRALRVGTQKTVRWPGYAEKATLLRELGLLSSAPVVVDGAPVVPKRVLDAVLYPRVRLEPGERDLTVLRVEVLGEARGRRVRYRLEMVDRYDERAGLTSMARTTSFTAAIVTRLIAAGAIRAAGVRTPEQVVSGALLDRLVEELGALGVHFDLTEERVERL